MKITVRLVEDHKTGKVWFEEKIKDNWIKISSTEMACEGNARYNLEKEIERRRQQLLKIHRSYGKEIEIEL